MMRAGSVVGRSMTSPKTLICFGSASSGIDSLQNASKSKNFATVPPPSEKRAEREAPPCLSFDPAASIRLYGRDVVRDGERHVKRTRIVAATARLTHVGRRPELDAVPAQPDNAELADGLVSDLRAKLTQRFMPRRDLTRIRIDQIHTRERELITALGHDVASTSGGLEMARIGIRLGGRMADGRDALDFDPIITIPDLDLKLASQNLDKRHSLSHSLSIFRRHMYPHPKIEREHVPTVLVRPQTNRPRLDRSDGHHIRAVGEHHSGEALQCVVDRLRPCQRRPRIRSAAHEHLEFPRVKRVSHQWLIAARRHERYGVARLRRHRLHEDVAADAVGIEGDDAL